MTVIYFADTRFPIERANGLQSMATCQALAAAGHAVHLVTRPDAAPMPRDPFEFYGLPPTDQLTFETIGTSRRPAVRRLKFLLGATRRAMGARDAIVYTRDLGVAALLLVLPRSRRPRVVYESHGVSSVVAAEMPRLLGKPQLAPSRLKLARLERQDRRVWRRAAAYVTITSALADDLAGRFGPRDEVFVVPDGAAMPAAPGAAPGAAPAADSATAGPPVAAGATAAAGPPVAAYAGHLYPWKGVDVFVRALAEAPGVRGLIVGGHPGEADLDRVQGLVGELGLEDRVDITGLVRPAEVANRLAAASILVLPNTASAISLRYTSPLKLFEYLALGRAIVASDLPAIREVLTDDETALLVAPGDSAALAAALERLAADPALLARLSRAAAALAPAYSWDERARRLDAVLEAAAAA
ncbi:MAG: glycosyltransferase family 4 protein [Vicinamibacterales bacterium]